MKHLLFCVIIASLLTACANTGGKAEEERNAAESKYRVDAAMHYALAQCRDARLKDNTPAQDTCIREQTIKNLLLIQGLDSPPPRSVTCETYRGGMSCLEF